MLSRIAYGNRHENNTAEVKAEFTRDSEMGKFVGNFYWEICNRKHDAVGVHC